MGRSCAYPTRDALEIHLRYVEKDKVLLLRVQIPFSDQECLLLQCRVLVSAQSDLESAKNAQLSELPIVVASWQRTRVFMCNRRKTFRTQEFDVNIEIKLP